VLGFDLVQVNGDIVRLEATNSDVADDGSIAVLADDNVVLRAGAGSWIEIRPIGRRLTTSWPPDNLDLLLDNLSYKLGVGFGHTQPGGVGPESSYRSGLLNELESLTAAVLGRVGLDASHSDNRPEADAVRDIIRRHFHLRRRAARQG
jgi:hypothetical protein